MTSTCSRWLALVLLVASALVAGALVPATLAAQDLVVDGMAADPAMRSITLGGVRRYDSVQVIRGGTILVPPYNGTDRTTTGNLVLIADSILVDGTSTITARGAGYSTVQCGNGVGPATHPSSGGRGGCSVRDSGGGGAHFGRGGRGTIDAPTVFPRDFEEDCGNTLSAGMCTDRTDCRTRDDGLPSVAGVGWFHSIYDIEFGASGGDKGCRDGDGFGGQPMVGGPGGGRIVLVALTPGATGTVQIDGLVTANGRRGCGTGNDSGGGGAGGSIFIVGDQVTVGASGRVTAAGGIGGDTFSAAVGQPDYLDCPMGAQTGGTCDDCGGGGGGGIVAVQSRVANFADGATFDVGGATGGVCPICRGEAGGGAGELQLDGLYVGEICDGYDNDFDGMTDEELGTASCGLGACMMTQPACDTARGVPTACAPTTSDASCFAARDAARPRIAVILDTSASMLLDLSGYPTFGDGSIEHPGLDTDGDGLPNDSRLALARESLASVISAYPEIDFALARYAQDMAENRFCQNAAWFECAGIVGTYDDPRDNTGAVACNVSINATTTVPVRRVSMGDECINYAGGCGGPRRGADVLSGFGTRTRDLVRWLDGQETRFIDDETTGDVCQHSRGGDCELRGAGPTPLAGSLQAIEDYITPIRATDAQRSCRTYSVILVTDGAESCDGDPAAAARELHDVYGIEVYVIAVSVLPSEEASLNAIASAGSGGATTTATFVRRPEDLVPALTSIIEDSLRTERCNGVDDNCNGVVDEGFAGLGTPCDDGARGVCRGTGHYVCTADELGTECRIEMTGLLPGVETCNAMDDDCDEGIDEGLTCTGGCTPTGPETCNGVDDNCNGTIDEADPMLGAPCLDGGLCEPGEIRCVVGMLRCVGGTPSRDEVCNGLDDDCDGVADDLAPCPATTACIEGACRRECDPVMEFPCPPGFLCEMPEGATESYCLPTPCASCLPGETCVMDTCVDPCDMVTCDEGLTCVGGRCVDCHVSGCAPGQLCVASMCQPDRCLGRDCGTLACIDGVCGALCGPEDCSEGERCAADGSCEADPCAGVMCESGRFCDEGTCRPDLCAMGMTCPAGDVCTPSRGCIHDPCATVVCPGGERCVVDTRGLAGCTDGGGPMPGMDAGMGQGRVFATGGGMCTIDPRRRDQPLTWVLFGLAAALLARRVRRGGGR
ncbi:MAG: VWA domain-containing protein [Sandaracinaceae bacterium]|nr:VWA domain-containing protein [Sandaracinaceae bacterium]